MDKMQVLRLMELPKNKPTSSTAEKILSQFEIQGAKGLGGGSNYVAPLLFRRAMIQETVTISGTSVALTTQLPGLSRVLFADITYVTAVTYATAVKLAVGIAGDPDAFLLSATGTTINQKATKIPLEATAINNTTTAKTAYLASVDTNGAAAGSATATATVRLIYEYITGQLPTE